MTGILVLIACGVAYCVYEVFNLKKMIALLDKDGISREKKKDAAIKERMAALIGKHVELDFKEEMYALDFIETKEGVIMDMDEAWMWFFYRKGKKEVQTCIRCDIIKDVKEIIA